MNGSMNLRIKKNDVYVYLFAALITIYYSIQNTPLYFAEAKLMLYFSLVLAGICIFFKPLKVEHVLLYIVITSVLVFITLINKGSYLLIIAVVIFICRDVNKENLLKLVFGIKILILLLGIFLHVYGSNNSTSLFIGMLILTYIVFDRQHIGIMKIYVLFSVDIILYLITNCGSGLICLTISVLLLLGTKFKFIKKFLTSKIIEWIYPIMLFITYITTLWKHIGQIPLIGNYIGQSLNEHLFYILNIIDKVTSYRISLNEITYRLFDIGWFGSDIDESIIKYGYYYLDSGYFSLLYDSGILVTIVFMIMSVLMMKYFIKDKNYVCIIAGISIALWAFNEPILLSINMNFMIFYWANMFEKRNVK